MPRTEARASTILRMFKHVGVTHMVGLPDNSSATLFSIVEQDPAIQLVTVTREGEAFAIASGLWIGGKSPVVVIQNTGLLESGDSLRGTASRMAIPLVVLVTCRGWLKLARFETGKTPPPSEQEILVRSDIDSIAFLTEPTFDAWHIPHARYGSDDDQAQFEAIWQTATNQERLAALLITHPLV